MVTLMFVLTRERIDSAELDRSCIGERVYVTYHGDESVNHTLSHNRDASRSVAPRRRGREGVRLFIQQAACKNHRESKVCCIVVGGWLLTNHFIVL